MVYIVTRTTDRSFAKVVIQREVVYSLTSQHFSSLVYRVRPNPSVRFWTNIIQPNFDSHILLRN